MLGVGPTEDAALKDAALVVDSMTILLPDHPTTVSRVVEITEDQASKYTRGVIDCKLLGIPGSV